MPKDNIIIQQGGTGVSGLTLLCLLFIGLKLTGYISWSWVWVLSPIWLPLAVLLGALLVGLGGYLLFHWWVK